jgi:hypothetical protein
MYFSSSLLSFIVLAGRCGITSNPSLVSFFAVLITRDEFSSGK